MWKGERPQGAIACRAARICSMPDHTISCCSITYFYKTQHMIANYSIQQHTVCLSLVDRCCPFVFCLSVLTVCIVSVSVCFLFVPLSLVQSLWFSCFVVHFPVCNAFLLLFLSLPLLFAMSCSSSLALVCWFLLVPLCVDVSFFVSWYVW